MAEFQAHRLNAHPWQCASCGQRNSGMTFPRCELCDSKVGPDGQDLEKVVGEAVRAAFRKMRNPPLEPVTGGGNGSVNTDGDSDYYDDDDTGSIANSERQWDRDGYYSDDSGGRGASGKGP
ncbi:unnamed protein product, partial [Ectocarpus sp. 12 AP-2014]